MTGFDNFPNELIVEVWRQVVDPESVENFALTSKRIYALGGKFIEEHNELKANFSAIVRCRYEADYALAATLETLLENSRAALYVRNVSIDWCQSKWQASDDHEKPGHGSYPKDTMELFNQAIKDILFRTEDEIVTWLKVFETGNEGPIICLILALVPNMYSLQLARLNSAEDLLFDMVNRVTESRDTAILSRLTEVRLLPGDIEDDEELNWVRLFATLPSVRAIEVWDIGPDCECLNHDYMNDCIGDCYGPDKTVDCQHMVCHERRQALLPRTSNVTHLTLINCVINTKRLFSFLEGLHTLESFEYHCPREFPELDEMVDVLRGNAKHTLRKLRLRSGGDLPQESNATSDIETKSYAIKLADFDVMEELEIEYDVLLDHRGSNKAADMLPSSIEKVHLSRLYTIYHWMIEDDVLELTMDKAERLPNLKKLTIELDQIDERLMTDRLSSMKQSCEDVGVLLDVTTEAPGTAEWSLSEAMNEKWCERRKWGNGFFRLPEVRWQNRHNMTSFLYSR